MSVFTKSAFTMSALPSPNTSQPPSAAPSRRGSFANGLASGQLTPVTDPHIVSINVESVLFDMDGTLINSSPAVVKAWELFAEKYPLDLDDILRSAHGMRTIDVLKKWCKLTDPEVLASEVVRFETAILTAAEDIGKSSGKSGIEVLPGVAKLLADLGAEADKRGGEEKWAICTSSTYFYAGQAIPIAGLPTPKVFVTADSVTRGKPFPDPYLLGASGCNASPFESIVVEDAPTGIRSGKASGALVLATCTSHHREELERERPDFLVEDLSHVKASWDAATNTFNLIIEQPVDRYSPRPTPDVTPVITPAMSRSNSFSGVGQDRPSVRSSQPIMKGSDDLTGNDSVVGSPAASRPGSPGGEDSIEKRAEMEFHRRASQSGQGGVTLDAFRRALAGNAAKRRAQSQGEMSQDE
ncbi:phosphatase [Cryptococcus deuterogattii 99/473]|uniref:Phosphatase n=2 Tax=Cryptococcus deuterogattii TaxID=1859096 RepID=A0A0D0VB38_9TREE|nr:phosphatase [Cryptococcus deuterogattii R265]KIR24902.1 phosphatase [Cryptococcus deuterogattii LA55]KIR37145.1 phosphatase [Cryptococcus deuterogattii MMRL2647]KIR43614.1 phosphatase [Cryptococcus deuterogattii Ram5]KIR74948.1 phosphatase [Cryptococcus deuterogattii CA1014]KIR92617.1 phosphatase [Cryptococcus deuterogattii CBS 10090]KIR97938.1 phosphatase [Cryptococcus deuterogattii 2001/935-1]KIY54778.1 phosphatase [Cryptococcus deuterogattii 99/473]